MKIGLVTEYFYPNLGGITEHIYHFYLELAKMGHDPVIVTSEAGSAEHIHLKDFNICKVGRCYPVYGNGSIGRLTLGFGVGRRLQEIFESEKFDIIHIHSPFFPTLATVAQRYSNTVTFGTFHTVFKESISLRIFRSMFQKYFDALHGKIAVSQACRKVIDKYFTGGEYRVIPNGVDTDFFRPDAKKIQAFADGKVNIFYLSRLEPRNGLDYLIRAFLQVHREDQNCRLIIGGEGPLRKYYESMIPREVKKDVCFVGRLHDDRPSYFATADIFCFPSTLAAFGITFLEGLAAGRPVLAFSLPAFEAMVQNRQDAMLCGNPSVANLASGLRELVADTALRQKMGINARMMAMRYSWPTVAKEVVQYYEDVLHAFA
ncbi:MAG TPA: glycosyltransferase family 1 protein [Deltaproteobacteria bacterium]|nr:MAG: hypothetical protein A2048_03500 [Deltaproteobacteria bacterium GWA2_45_12]HBF11961.1 glycosyltransferase family 1 protein [Deltaproteobacteria bacterium]